MDISPDSVSHKFVTKFSDVLFTKFGDLENSSPNLVINPSQKLTLNTLKLIPPEYYRTPISQFCRPHTKTGCTNIPPHYFPAKIRFQQQLCGNWNICPQTPNIDWDYSNLTPTVHIIRRISDVYKDHLTPPIDQWGLNQRTSEDFKHSMFKWFSSYFNNSN